MKNYENNDATRFIEKRFFEYDFENEFFPGEEDMKKLNSISNFIEYVYDHAKRCGYQDDFSNIAKLAAFLGEKCKEAGVNISRQTLGNWLSKGLPANTASGRENVYRLCFALQMDAYQAGEFFLKAYLERPFNYKNIHEAVYFFCLNNGLKYSDAVRIIDTVEAMPIVDNPDAENVTELIGEKLSEIRTEGEFLQYMLDNRSGFAIQNQTATNKIAELVESCIEIAPEEWEHNNWQYGDIDKKEYTVKNIDDLLNVIYGYQARATISEKTLYKRTISKSRFPELIKRNWPQREQFQNILEKKTASYDVIRKALIMLQFYDFFAHAVVEMDKAKKVRRKTGKEMEFLDVSNGLLNEFADETNQILADCGYVQLYWRNPFDWMIGYCAQSMDPLEELRNIIEEYYLDDLDDLHEIDTSGK